MYIFTQLLLHLVPLALLLAATAAGRPAAVNPSAAQPARRQVIISTDPGIDDTIALLLAVASPELELRAVCVDFGSLHNVSQLTHNALAVLALAGAPDVPVFVGAGGPIAAAFHDLGGPLFHGVDGLGGVTPPGPGPRHGANLTLTAAEYIVEACRTSPTPPALVSLAPLTNIALALDLEPRLPELCPDLWIMGGTVVAPGNVSPVAEANIANDAEAAQRVFGAGFKLRVAGLDVTMQTWLNTSYRESLRGLPGGAGPFIFAMTEFYTNAYRVHAGYGGGMPLHDPSAVMMLLRPDLYGLVRHPVAIDTAQYPAPTRGLVIADRRGGPLSPASNSTTEFAMQVDVDGVLHELLSRIAKLP